MARSSVVPTLFILFLFPTLVNGQDDCRCIGNPGCPCLNRPTSSGGSRSSGHRSTPHTYLGKDGYRHPDPGYQWASHDPDDFSVEPIPGTPHPKYKHVIWADHWSIRPEDGYDWVSNSEKDRKVVRAADGTLSRQYPNVVIIWERDQLRYRPAFGYEWASSDPRQDQLRVRLIAAETPGAEYPNTIWDGNARLYPAPGYQWVVRPPVRGDFRVEPLPAGTPHSTYPNVVWDGTGKIIRPADGYRWVTQSAGDFRVEPLPAGTPHSTYPNVVWDGTGKIIRPANGYRWVTQTSGDFRVEPIPAGTPSGQYPNTVWDGSGGLSPAENYQWVNQPHVPGDFRVKLIPSSKPYKLLKAVESAAKSPRCTGRGNCNFFVGKAGKDLEIPYFKNVLTAERPDRYLANNMYGFISKATQSKPSLWRRVTSEEAQKLANQGEFVIGVAQNVRPSADGHGHIVIVVPDTAEHSEEAGSGPWVRDNRHSDKSVRASYSFCEQGTQCSKKKPQDTTVTPIYAVWQNPDQ